MTQLRQMMLDELQRRNYAQSTAEAYVYALKEFAAYYQKPPDRLGPKEICQFQLHLLRDRKLAARTVMQRVAAVRIFYVLKSFVDDFAFIGQSLQSSIDSPRVSRPIKPPIR